MGSWSEVINNGPTLQLHLMLEKCEIMDDVFVEGEVPLPPPLPPLLSPVTPSPAPNDPLAVHRVEDRGSAVTLPTDKLRPLYWEKLQDCCSNSSNVWSSLPTISHDINVDQKELQKLFYAKKRNMLSSRSSAPGITHTVRLLSQRKSQALAIMLHNLPDGVELKEMIANMDCEAIDPSVLVTLADVLPSEDEIQKIQAYHIANPRMTLDAPEQFVLQISSIDFFKEKSRCLLYRSQFYEKLSVTKQGMGALDTACKLLYKNDELSKVLGLVLTIGNRMNMGSIHRGGAFGFKLDLLNKLRDVRSSDRESNLLQFLVQCYLKSADNYKKEKCPLPCSVQLAAATQMSLEDIQSNLEFLSLQLQECEALCIKLKKAANDFYKNICSFSKKAHDELHTAKNEVKELSALCHKLLKYYCVPDCPLQEFLSLWIPFLQSFKSYWEKEKFLVAQQKIATLQAERLRATPTHPLSHNGLKARLKSRNID